MTIETPEFEGSPEAEHEWKDTTSKKLNEIEASLTALTERVVVNEEYRESVQGSPAFEVKEFGGGQTIITPFSEDYTFGMVLCYFTVNPTSNSDSTFAYEDPDLATDFNRKLSSRVITNAATNNRGSFGAMLTRDELQNGRVQISASGASVAPFTVNKWIVIRFRSEA